MRLLTRVSPNWDGLLRNLRREGTPERVYYFEHGMADNILDALARQYELCDDLSPGTAAYPHQKRLAVHRFLGHELMRVFPQRARLEVPRREGAWTEEGRGVITTWEEFDIFPWPRIDDADFSVLDYYDTCLPAEMRVFHVMDLWDAVRELFGFETLCYVLYEDPELVQAVVDRVGGFIEDVVRTLCQYQCFGAVYIADDLGHKSGLMFSPEIMRRYVLPWHQRLAEIAHAHEKLFFLHSCGMMYELMNDYIDQVHIDAKHSFEENVLPVTAVKSQYGSRMSLLGGVDVDLLARGTEAEVRMKTREILTACQPGGGYCLGSGNWVTDYIPLDNYVAMLDEARQCAC